MILLCSNEHGVSSICYWEDQCLMKKVVCDFFFKAAVYKMTQENCEVLRMEMENVFQHTC